MSKSGVLLDAACSDVIPGGLWGGGDLSSS